MDRLEIKLRTLTPIWTGGVDGKVDRIHETGILGSLRWWYEAIVRGLGGQACDPTDTKCIYKREQGESHEQAYARLCDACKLFGCTGWRRRFRLSVEISDSPFESRFCLATLNKAGTFNHWWLTKIFESALGERLPFNDLNLHIQFLPGSESHKAALKGLLSLMAHYGGIGAKTQYGFGQFDWAEKLSPASAIEAIQRQLDVQPSATTHQPSNYYTLRCFWHLSCLIPDTDRLVRRFKSAKVVGDERTFQHWQGKYLPVSFDVRYKLPGSDNGGLRQRYRLSKGKMAARKTFGTLEDDKLGSRVFVSHLFKQDSSEQAYHLNVWGFTEPDLGDEIQRYLKDMFPNIDIDQVTGPQLLERTTNIPQVQAGATDEEVLGL